MSPLLSIRQSLSTLDASLALDWYIQSDQYNEESRPSELHDWAGMLHPDRHHHIEIIHRENQAQVSEWLVQQKSACIWLVCDNTEIPATLLKHSCTQPLNIIRSPLPADEVLHTLLHHLAENASPHAHEHGVLMQIAGLGVLISGKSGSGKSSLALELVERKHQLVADDAPLLYQYPGSGEIRPSTKKTDS